MSKNSVLGKPLQKAQLSKHGFNMSHNLKFTSSCGHILPVFYDFVNPGESYKISYDLFTRSQPLATAAMVDIDEYIDTFFVPLSMINHRANEILMGISDKWSDMFTSEYQDMPVVNVGNLDYSQWPQPHPWLVNGDGFAFGAMRLCDMFNIPPDFIANADPITTPVTPEDFSPSLSVMYFCAYQAVFYSYYRLSNWLNNDVGAYNVDSVQNGANNEINDSQFVKIFTIQYRPYQRDYFRAIEPSPLINSIGLYQNSATVLQSVNQWLGTMQPITFNSNTQINSSDVSSVGNNVQQVVSVTNIGGTTSNVLASGAGNLFRFTSPTAIRTMFAVDKLMRVTGLAGKHYDDQVMAHFGFKVPKEYSNEVHCFGNHHQVIHVGEIISTASTNQAELGTIAGKGYSKGHSKDFKFTAPCHGIILGLYSCTPRLDAVAGFDKLHTAYRRQDFYIPELDNLGMQPLFGYESYGSSAQASYRAGWQYRYMQYKTKYDRATRAFTYFKDSTLANAQGSFRDWALAWHPTLPTWDSTGSSLLYCKPSDLDPIMLVSYYNSVSEDDYHTNGPSILYSTDPLIHSLRISAFKTSTMSIYGLEKDL